MPTMNTDEEKRAFCDLTVERAATLMVESGAPMEMMLDRMLTYAGAQIVFIEGKDGAIASIRALAVNIENGAFDSIDARRPANTN